MTTKRKEGSKNIEVNWDEIETYKVSLSYSWYLNKDSTRTRSFLTRDEAEDNRNKLISKIKKDWWLEFELEYWILKKVFVFASDLHNLTLRAVAPTERVNDVSAII